MWEQISITGMADRGKAVGRDAEGRVVFVEGAVPGDIVDALVLRKKKGAWQGVVEHFQRLSPDRVTPACSHFQDCGGCKWQHLSYEGQLKHKQQIVQDVMRRIAKLDPIEIGKIIGTDQIFHYRNKMEYSFSNQRWKTKEQIAEGSIIPDDGALGLHPPGFFNKVVDIKECWLQDPKADLIRNFIRSYADEHQLSYFDPISHRGFLRNMIIRNSHYGQWMLVMSLAEARMTVIEKMMQAIQAKFPWINSLHYVINEKKNDTLFDQQIIRFSGQDHIIEQLGNLKFKIRPKSFFQTNTKQAEKLYQITKEFCDLNEDEVLYDLYTGTGSIALYLADRCKEVIGIEEVPDAIRDAQENATLNDIRNANFYVGDVKNILKEEVLHRHRVPDVIVTDPPRIGMHEQVIDQIIKMLPNRLVYVSCNPATQARDLALLAAKYELIRMQPVDMFPHTNHIENIALLSKRNI